MLSRALRRMDSTQSTIYVPRPSPMLEYGEWQNKQTHYEMIITISELHPLLYAYSTLFVRVNHSLLGEQTATSYFPKPPTSVDTHKLCLEVDKDRNKIIIQACGNGMVDDDDNINPRRRSICKWFKDLLGISKSNPSLGCDIPLIG